MGFQDRHYYRDGGSGTFNPLRWLATGSVPLFTFAGIRVRAHASLLVFIAAVLLFGLGEGYSWQDRMQSMSILFLIVLLHEFGHCFAARWVGGEADEIQMSPLGGLALARPPNRWKPTFITIAGGPLVNLLICGVCYVATWAIYRWGMPINPFKFDPTAFRGWADWLHWLNWVYAISYFLLVFNLLPIFPFDGGRMLQTLLWPIVGLYRATNIACIVGLIGGVLMIAVALATHSPLLFAVAFWGFVNCYVHRRQLVALGPEGLEDQIDYSAAYENYSPRPKRRNRWAARRAVKLARAEVQEQEQIDRILAKVSASGMQSLTWMERRALRKATEHQRERDAELTRLRGQ